MTAIKTWIRDRIDSVYSWMQHNPLTAVCVVAVAVALAGLALRGEDTRDAASDAQQEVRRVTVQVNAKTCGEGNLPACDRICRRVAPRLVVIDPSGRELGVSCTAPLREALKGSKGPTDDLAPDSGTRRPRPGAKHPGRSPSAPDEQDNDNDAGGTEQVPAAPNDPNTLGDAVDGVLGTVCSVTSRPGRPGLCLNPPRP